MAEIRIITTSHLGGPDMPVAPYALLHQRPWPGGGTVPVLCIQFACDDVEIWPFDADHIEALGRKLIALAEERRALK